MKQVVCAFDFDGTLTSGDSFLDFVRFDRGTLRFIIGFLRYSPLILLMLLHVCDNGKVKQKIFSYFFRGMTLDEFDRRCRAYARARKDSLLREDGRRAVVKALQTGYRVVIVTASIEDWVAPFFTTDPLLSIVGTKIEVCHGRLTGRFLTKNCYGQEKVNRIKLLLPDREAYTLIAFGDSRGDRELLRYADRSFLCRHNKVRITNY